MTVATPPVYELWDVEAGNLIADYDDESAAMLAIRESVNEDGSAAWASVELVRVSPSGERLPIAHGDDLIARAMGAGTPGTSTPGAESGVPLAIAVNSSPPGHSPTVDAAARAVGAQSQALVDTANRSIVNANQSLANATKQMLGLGSAHQSLARAHGPSSTTEALRSALGAGLASQGLRELAGAFSAAAAATDTLRALGARTAMVELQTAAASIAALDSSRAMQELRTATALLKEFNLSVNALDVQHANKALAALNADFASGTDRLAEMTRSVSAAMADMFANGAAAIAFRTSDGFVEVGPTGDVVRIPADDDTGSDELAEAELQEGITLQEYATIWRLRLVAGSVMIKSVAYELGATGD